MKIYTWTFRHVLRDKCAKFVNGADQCVFVSLHAGLLVTFTAVTTAVLQREAESTVRYRHDLQVVLFSTSKSRFYSFSATDTMY